MTSKKPCNLPLKHIEMDATRLDINLVMRRGEIVRPRLVTVKGKDGLAGCGGTTKSAIKAYLKALEKQPQEPESTEE